MNMALTEEEKKELVQNVVNQIKTDSQSVDELETVSTLDGVVSLPCHERRDGGECPIETAVETCGGCSSCRQGFCCCG